MMKWNGILLLLYFDINKYQTDRYTDRQTDVEHEMNWAKYKWVKQTSVYRHADDDDDDDDDVLETDFVVIYVFVWGRWPWSDQHFRCIESARPMDTRSSICMAAHLTSAQPPLSLSLFSYFQMFLSRFKNRFFRDYLQQPYTAALRKKLAASAAAAAVFVGFCRGGRIDVVCDGADKIYISV